VAVAVGVGVDKAKQSAISRVAIMSYPRIVKTRSFEGFP
jgi:hypothetical protein